jgi:hypothetical protein
MQERIEDILTDHGMRPVTKISGPPLIVIAANTDAVPMPRPAPFSQLVQARA